MLLIKSNGTIVSAPAEIRAEGTNFAEDVERRTNIRARERRSGSIAVLFASQPYEYGTYKELYEKIRKDDRGCFYDGGRRFADSDERQFYRRIDVGNRAGAYRFRNRGRS